MRPIIPAAKVGHGLATVVLPALLVTAALASPAHAKGWTAPAFPPEAVCMQAIQSAEPGSGLPPRLLAAIGRVESGKPDPRTGLVQPWPWTINAENKGTLFATKAEAMAAVIALRARGVYSIDVGCMQINLLHHATAFATLEEAFDPLRNVAYAVRFLSDLHGETRDWRMSAAYYHSRNADLAYPYQQRVVAGVPGGLPGIGLPGISLAASLNNPLALGFGRPQPITPRSALSSAWASTLTTQPSFTPTFAMAQGFGIQRPDGAHPQHGAPNSQRTVLASRR